MKQAIAWIDHHEARVVSLLEEGYRESTVKAPPKRPHRHPKDGLERAANPHDALVFFGDVAKALNGYDELLIVGPAKAKKEFIAHVETHERALKPRIVGVEAMDHPTDGQLAAYARLYFASHGPNGPRSKAPTA